MDAQKEIQEIIKGLKSSKKHKGINENKLIQLFSSAELDVPDSVGELEVDFDYLRFIRNSNDKKDEKLSLVDILLSKKWIPASVMTILLLAVVGLFSTSVFLTPVSNGTVYNISGNVLLQRGKFTRTVKEGDLVTSKDVIVTKDSSFVDIKFEDFLRFRLTNNSNVSLNKISLGSFTGRFNALLSRGTLIVQVNKLRHGDEVSFNTPISQAVIRGTLFTVSVGKGEKSKYEVFDGKIKVQNVFDDKIVTVNEKIAEQISQHYEDKAVVIGQSQICTVFNANKSLQGISGDNFQEKISNISGPAIAANGSTVMEMTDEVHEFLGDANKKDDSFNVIPCRFSVDPSYANMTIDGVKRNYNQGEIYLTTGKHQIEVSADGFKTKTVQKLIDADNYTFQVKLERDENQTVPQWHKRLRSKYILHSPKNKYLISIKGNGEIEAYDKNRKRWIMRLFSPIISKPLISGDKLFVATGGRKIIGISSKNGKILWNNRINDTVHRKIEMVLNNGYLYTVTRKGTIYKFSDSGKMIWKQTVGGTLSSSLVMTRHMVLVSTGNGILMGLDKRKGYKVFRVRLNSKIRAMDNSNDNIYLATRSGEVLKYNYNDDEIIWRYDTKDKSVSNILIDGRSLFVFSRNGSVIKLNDRGGLSWKYSIGKQKTMRRFFDKKSLYIVGDRTLFVIDKNNGFLKWSVVLSPVVSKNITFTKDKLYFTSKDKGLVILNKE